MAYNLLIRTAMLSAIILAGSVAVFAQTDASGRPMHRPSERPPKAFREMQARQRLEREKKDHEEMIERGEKALQIANQLELSLQQNAQFTSKDRERLSSLKGLVEKIRKDLGGKDDDHEILFSKEDNASPSTVQEAFQFLKSTTVKLVDELKKTSRFSISAAAIHTSNQVLRLLKFVSLRK